MRVLRYLVLAFLGIAVVAGLAFVVTREALLTWSVWGVKDALVSLRAMSGNPEQFATQCDQYRTSLAQPSPIKTVELAFSDDTHYQLQLICANYIYAPVVVKEFELGPLVTKVPGSAGFVASPTTQTSVSLELWGRTQTITLEDKEAKVSQGPATTVSTLAPFAACKAYGFQCCAEDATQGFGNSAPAANDCPQTCFAQCLVRPVVLSFNTSPFFDPKNRTITIPSGQSVTFSYTSSAPGSKIKSVVLDFGDTQTYKSASSSASVNHDYYCVAQSCEYQAVLTVTDERDLTNSTNTVNQVKVVVQPQLN